MADSISRPRGISARHLVFLIICYAGFFLFFFIRSSLSFSTIEFLPRYLWSWVFSNTFLTFNSYLLAIHLTAVMSFYSLVFTFRKREAMPPIPSFFHSIATSSIFLLLVLTCAFVVTTEWLKPRTIRQIEDMKYRTELARGFLDEAEKLKGNNLYDEARTAVENYLRIDPESPKALTLKRDLIELQSDRMLDEEMRRTVSDEEIRKAGGFTSRELLNKAEDYFTAKDYASAHYYANLALGIDPGNREAKTIVTKAIQRLSIATLDSEDEARSRLFQQKKEGYDALTEGDTLGAYYIFRRLREIYPEDPDIEKYFALTTNRLTEVSFFRDESESLLHLPGFRNIIFVNEKTDNFTELIHFGKMHILDTGTYMEEIEVIRLSSAYKIIFHFTAPYGKLNGTVLSMHAVGRTDAQDTIVPVYLTGSRPALERNFIPLKVSADSLRYFSSDTENLAAVWLPDLWRLKDTAPMFGYSGDPYQIEFMLRIVTLFSFFVLSLFAMAAGWSFRPAWGRPPILSLIFLPLFPFVLQILTGIYLQANRLLLGFLYLAVGFVPTTIIYILLQIVLAAAALILLAGQTMKSE